MTLSEPKPRRFRWSVVRHAAVERMSEFDVRWRALGALFVAGGTLAAGSLLLPVARGTDVQVILLVGLSAIVSGLAMIVFARLLPKGDLWVSSALGFGTVLITMAVAFNHSQASPYALIYIWVGFDAFFFLKRRAAFCHLLFVGAGYAFALSVGTSTGEANGARWMLTIGTVGVVATLADLLRERSDRLISRLGDAARTDSLTGLLNRRGFEERMASELERARRAQSSVSLVVGDLDHFKMVNDSYGHQSGDDALRQFSRLAEETKRTIDAAARIGGEEFALVLPHTDEHGAYLMAERLRRRVRQASAADGPELTMSFGVATFPAHGASAQRLLRSADQAMYLAKRLGRDRTVIFSAEVTASFQAGENQSAGTVEQLPAVLTLAETLDLRDSGTARHSQTVGRYAEAIAVELGLAADRVERIRLAGLLHDIGKLGVADPILRKAGPLDEAEWDEMRKHPELGARILASANLDDISGWVIAHHERPDGLGYPAGLALEDIPIEARILSVADSFEAMTSQRVYQSSMTMDAAMAELLAGAGTQFDEQVVAAFIRSLGSERMSAAVG
ncbi:MAG: diguanylate cyclase and metal dependent phosphohydrolase [Solirubrobacteraceae bacterium]|nr:diguanylate cyclase and metal dependent phosphohydrolase [Solirubrobacteraceae bacterium]